jgi:hypothetical protein
MIAKQFAAIAALSTLSLVVACSGSNGGSGGTGSNVLPASPTSARDSGFASDSDFVADAKSPIKIAPKKLFFNASGTSAAKKISVSETKYKGLFKFISTCGKDVKISPKSSKGPKTSFTVTPVGSVTCTITFSDKAKNKGTVSVLVKLATPSPSPSPSPSPTATASPTSSPASGIVNGNFASGNLAPGWKACSFSHAGYAAPVQASPDPQGTAAQPTTPTTPISAADLAKFGNSVGTPPPNLNPNELGALPTGLSAKAAMTGDQNSENTGASGICQAVTVPASAHFLSFYAYEGGSEYSFGYADQEADVMTADGTAIQKTLFAEDNCFWDPGKVGATGYLDSGCIPLQYGSTSSYTDWQGGYWVKRGPYDLSAYAGKSITLYLGVWDDSTHNTPYPDTYSNEMWVTNVQLSSSSSFPATFAGRSR